VPVAPIAAPVASSHRCARAVDALAAAMATVTVTTHEVGPQRIGRAYLLRCAPRKATQGAP
jgi:hypothetical protein